jgi:hypothetical protein
VVRHASPAVFIHKDLADSTHVFLRQDAVHRPLDPPYSGPYKVLARTKKTMRIAMNGRPVTVSTDGQARLHHGGDLRLRHDCSSTPRPVGPARKQCRPLVPVAASASRHSSTYEHLSPRGGDVGTPHKSTSGPFQGPAQPMQRPFPGPRSPAATGHSDQSEGSLL